MPEAFLLLDLHWISLFQSEVFLLSNHLPELVSIPRRLCYWPNYSLKLLNVTVNFNGQAHPELPIICVFNSSLFVLIVTSELMTIGRPWCYGVLRCHLLQYRFTHNTEGDHSLDQTMTTNSQTILGQVATKSSHHQINVNVCVDWSILKK